MQPVTREPLSQAFDYYVVTAADRGIIDRLRLATLYEGASSGAILARRVEHPPTL